MEISDEEFLEIQQITLDQCHKYFEAFAKKFGKKGFIWLKDNETDQLMVYTRKEYTKQILDFLNTLDGGWEQA